MNAWEAWVTIATVLNSFALVCIIQKVKSL